MSHRELLETWCKTEEGMKWVHNFCSENRRQLKESDWAGCFYCGELFKADSVKSFLPQSDTAICPLCHIDSVIGDASGVPLNHKLLLCLHKYWFS